MCLTQKEPLSFAHHFGTYGTSSYLLLTCVPFLFVCRYSNVTGKPSQYPLFAGQSYSQRWWCHLASIPLLQPCVAVWLPWAGIGGPRGGSQAVQLGAEPGVGILPDRRVRYRRIPIGLGIWGISRRQSSWLAVNRPQQNHRGFGLG